MIIQELRVQDYAQNRKTASTGGAFGQSAFSGGGAFGTTQPQQSAFGAPTPSTGAFGAFGQPQQPQPAPTTSAFGATTGTSPFGQPAPQPQQQSAFGSFGQTNQQQQPQQQPQTSAFGGGSAFGTTAAKPATGFGGFGGGTTSTFGNTGATNSVFGQPNNQQPQQPSAFGQPSTNNTGLNAFANSMSSNFSRVLVLIPSACRCEQERLRTASADYEYNGRLRDRRW